MFIYVLRSVYCLRDTGVRYTTTDQDKHQGQTGPENRFWISVVKKDRQGFVRSEY